MMRKGIILAGGSGERLRPLTNYVCKQLLPVYNKPMLHYPISTLILIGIEEFLIICTPKDLPVLKQNLGDGSQYGISIQYAIQEAPNGLAEAFLIGADFIGEDPVCLMLGDNFLYWGNLNLTWEECLRVKEGAYIVGVPTSEPERYGVIESNDRAEVVSLEEKPGKPKSNIAAIGLYFYDGNVVEYAKTLTPSSRGELEITDLNNIYLEKKQLKAKFLSRGVTWLDTGTYNSLLDTANFVQIVERYHGLMIGCIEEAAYVSKRIGKDQLKKLASAYGRAEYGQYLMRLAG